MKKLIKYFALLLLLNGATGANAQIYDPSKITPEQKKRDECIRLSNHNPQKAIDMAIDWRSHFSANDAEYCLGIANIINDNFEYGAGKLMEIAACSSAAKRWVFFVQTWLGSRGFNKTLSGLHRLILFSTGDLGAGFGPHQSSGTGMNPLQRFSIGH